MPRSESPCLSIAIARLNSPETDHFATWVFQAPYQRGYVHHDLIWPETLSQTWQAWIEMFSLDFPGPFVPRPGKFSGNDVSLAEGQESEYPQTLSKNKSLSKITPTASPRVGFKLTPSIAGSSSGKKLSYSSRLMQQLGIELWQWLFDGPVHTSLHQSQGIAMGQERPLRVRLDLREPDLIALPWEIMQPQAGQPAISLSRELLFSRTTSDVNALSERPPSKSLNVLLVLGENPPLEKGRSPKSPDTTEKQVSLELETEAAQLQEVLEGNYRTNSDSESANLRVPCLVDTLIQPTRAELISSIETKAYNIFFYAGHGTPGADGGELMLGPHTTLNGTELAQVLVRNQVTLAVFNACWGARPAMETDSSGRWQTIPRSSLAEVLIHHGVPAVLGMRDSISDREALSFMKAFAEALSEGMLVDRAVALARQNLLTLYKFNQPAWTLPVLYMHPEFQGQLVEVVEDVVTQLPTNSQTWLGHSLARGYLRLQGSEGEIWPMWAGILRVGRWDRENDVVVQEKWVSQKHAEIFSRTRVLVAPVSSNSTTTGGERKNSMPEEGEEPVFFLRDFSRYGTLILESEGWQRVHREEVVLRSGTLLKFGSSQGRTFEFIIETN